MAAHEIGLPYGKGLEALGLDPARLVLVRTRNGAESLWAMEEALKSRAAAIVAESWVAPRAYDLSASRRLLLAARRGGGLGLLLLLRACGEAARLTSAAQLRFEIAAPPPPERTPGQRLPPPGPPAWRLRIAKARAGLPGLGEVDPLAWRDISFDPEKAVFHHAFSERVPAPPADRPDLARRQPGRLKRLARSGAGSKGESASSAVNAPRKGAAFFRHGGRGTRRALYPALALEENDAIADAAMLGVHRRLASPLHASGRA